MIPWQETFSSVHNPDSRDPVPAGSISQLRQFLDAVHIRYCLVRPYQEMDNYPVVESRELLPSFESDMFEYTNLPGFSLVALGRQLDYFSEIFQYDKLHAVQVENNACPLENLVGEQNIQTMSERLPRRMQGELREAAANLDVTLLENYTRMLPFLLEMDRAHVFSLDTDSLFHLSGIFASFPSDIDSEIKRAGVRMGKFAHGDSAMYERNRMFVYQYLMELYGFPIVSERRTSSALFARKLHRMNENFLLRVMGQSDRTLTTYTYEGENSRYPRLDKIALVAVDEDQEEAIEIIGRKGFFLDQDRRVVIMRVSYRQHKFDPANVRQDRALSVAQQDILHPRTGKSLAGLNIIKDASNIFLRLNDIVRGEYTGRIIYKRSEIVENTDTDEKKLKFLYSWLCKHQRRMISYPEEYFDNVSRVINGYLQNPLKAAVFDARRELYQEVRGRFSYIQQARRARALEDLSRRVYKGSRISYREMCERAVDLLNEMQYEIVDFFPELVDSVINCCETILHDRYLVRNYIEVGEGELSRSGLEVRKNYGRIVSLADAIRSVRKTRLQSAPQKEAE